MNILFVHRDFPGQFKYLAPVLAQDPKNIVIFITAENTIAPPPGINKLPYTPTARGGYTHPCLKEYETFLAHGQAAAEMAMMLKSRGIKPDVIFGHIWGPSMFIKDIFPDVPLLSYCEWFDKTEGSAIGFGGDLPDDSYREQIICGNTAKILELCACDGGISPTQWQKQQFPKEFHDKIKVIHDGVDTNLCKPDPQAKFLIPDKNLELTSRVGSLPHHQEVGNNLVLTSKDEIITYATRGMEPMRGFVQFMEAADKILKKRPNTHIIIGGNDKVCYGKPLAKGTYKQLMLNKLDLDMKRVHFVGGLDFNDYLKLLQISSAHVYSTYPFILSWSILEAMAVGCCLIASNTAPVLEIIKDNYNGLLFDFFDVDGLVEKIEYALDNKEKMQEIRNNARQTVLEKYDLKRMIVEQIIYLQSLMKR